MTSPSDFYDDSFGEPIYRVTRAQLIDDGTLADLSALHGPIVERAGVKIHAAMTATAYGLACWPIDDRTRAKQLKDAGAEENSLLDDHVRRVMSAYRQTVRRRGKGTNTLGFAVTVLHSPGEYREIDLKAIVSAGDSGEPVLTILLPDED